MTEKHEVERADDAVRSARFGKLPPRVRSEDAVNSVDTGDSPRVWPETGGGEEQWRFLHHAG